MVNFDLKFLKHGKKFLCVYFWLVFIFTRHAWHIYSNLSWIRAWIKLFKKFYFCLYVLFFLFYLLPSLSFVPFSSFPLFVNFFCVSSSLSVLTFFIHIRHQIEPIRSGQKYVFLPGTPLQIEPIASAYELVLPIQDKSLNFFTALTTCMNKYLDYRTKDDMIISQKQGMGNKIIVP